MMGWRIHILVRQKISSKALDFLQLTDCGHKTHFSHFLRIIKFLKLLNTLPVLKGVRMLWRPSNSRQNPQIIFSLPKRKKKSLLPDLFTVMNPNKSHIKSHLSSMRFVHIFSLHPWGWWSFSEVKSCCQPSPGAGAWWGCLGASPTCEVRTLVSKSLFCWLHGKEQRLLSVQVLIFYPGNQTQCLVWRSMPSCVGSGLTHQSSWLQSSFTFTTAEVNRRGEVLIGLCRHLAPNPWLGRY